MFYSECGQGCDSPRLSMFLHHRDSLQYLSYGIFPILKFDYDLMLISQPGETLTFSQGLVSLIKNGSAKP